MENCLDTQSPPSSKRDDILLRQERSVRLLLLLALIWALPCLLLAIFSDSLLLLSDVPDNARFILSSFMTWRVLRSIRLGQLHGFDYGTGKVEVLGSFLSSIAYILTLLILAGFTVHRLMNPTPLDDTFTPIAAGTNLLIFFISGWFWHRNKALAAEQPSPLMEMQWRSDRADALSTLVVVIALILWLLLKQHDWAVFIDPICALIFITYAIVSFLPVIKSGLNDILDKTLQEDLQLIIDKRLIEFFHQFDNFHGVRSRRTGDRTFIEVALSFAPEQQMSEVSDTVSKLCKSIEQDLVNSEVRVVLIPCSSAEITE